MSSPDGVGGVTLRRTATVAVIVASRRGSINSSRMEVLRRRVAARSPFVGVVAAWPAEVKVENQSCARIFPKCTKRGF